MEEDKEESRIEIEHSKIVINKKNEHLVDTTQPSRNLNIQTMSSTSSRATSDLVDRIKKEEIPIEEWDQCDMINPDDLMVEVKMEKVELEIHDDMDTLNPVTGVFMPNTSDNSLTDGVVLNRIKTEDIKIEKLGESDFPTNLVEDKKLQNEKMEKMMPGVDSAEIYPVQLTEELVIKNDIDPFSDVASESYTAPDLSSFSCYNCEYTTRYKSDLVEHVATHGILELSCTQCHKIYKSRSSLDDHVIKNHPGLNASVIREVFECRECTYKTMKKCNFERHMMNHPVLDSRLKCAYCNNWYKQKNGLDNHIVNKHPLFIASVTRKIHECPKCCFKTAQGKIYMDNHVVKNHPDLTASVTSAIYECRKCEFKTPFKSRIFSHALTHSRGLSQDEADETKSAIKNLPNCNKGKRFLDEHMIQKHPDFIGSVSSTIHECEHCSFKTTIKDKISKHVLKHSSVPKKALECAMCGFKPKRGNALVLDDHILKKHPNSIKLVSSEVKKCPLCVFKTTRSKTCLDDHIVRNHPRSTHLVDSEIYGCKHCSFQTTLKCYLSRHASRHNKTPIRYTCVKCNAVYSKKKLLDDHVIKNHPNSTKSVSNEAKKCPLCAFKTTRSQTYLDDHILRKHPNSIQSVESEIYGCKQCSYQTTLKSYLSRHVSRHSKTPIRYTCVKCNAVYKEKRLLDDHILKKHPNSTKLISSEAKKCPLCAFKTTRSQTYLDDHIVQKHPNSTELVDSEVYGCKHCSFQTTLKCYISRHASTHFKTLISYTCVKCNAVYSKKKRLDDHVIKNHPNYFGSVTTPIQECIMCTFKTTLGKFSLDEHILQKHPSFMNTVTSKIYACTNCNYKTVCKAYHSRHIMLIHSKAAA